MKKITMMLVVLFMSFSLAACGNSGKTQNNEMDEDNSRKDLELTVDADYANLPESQGFEFESNGDGTCKLTKIGTCSDTDLVIPEKSPKGDIVTMIDQYAYRGAENIGSIIFAGRTMEIDKKAFQSCEAKKIVINGCDLSVGDHAFSYCEDVSEIDISNSNLEIDKYVFYDTGKDMTVKIQNCTGALDEKAFQSSAIKELTIRDCTLELGDHVFSYCEDLETLVMENSKMEIGKYAFYDTGDDMTATFTGCETNMEDKAFQSCGLITLNISGGDTVMEQHTFSYCENLKNVVIGANNTEIGEYSFYGCKSLENASIAADSEDDNLKLVIDDKVFEGCALQNVVIGRGQIEIGNHAFSYCEDLVSVEIKGVLSKMDDYAFHACPEELVIKYDGRTYNEENFSKETFN